MEILNKRVRFDYFIEEEIEAGIVLTGTEIKSVRGGKCNIVDCYGIIKNNEIFLLNMFISHYKEGNIYNHDETRTRKLLLHKKEIKKLSDAVSREGKTLVPLKLYFKDNNIKFDIIFLDPPYKDNYIEVANKLIDQYNLLRDGGIIVCESSFIDKIVYNNFKEIKSRKYGDKYVVILQKC